MCACQLPAGHLSSFQGMLCYFMVVITLRSFPLKRRQQIKWGIFVLKLCLLVIDFCSQDLYFDICAKELVTSEFALHPRQVNLNFLSRSFPTLGLAS